MQAEAAEKDAIRRLDLANIKEAAGSQKVGCRFKFFKKAKKERKGAVRIPKDPLPVVLVAKYLGEAPSQGYSGIAAVRQPVDGLIAAGKSLRDGVDLPLVSLCAGEFGLRVEPHPMSRGRALEPFLFPIQFLSYAVQDDKFCRVFAVIFVKNASLQSETPVCHAFVCPSSAMAQRLALALAEAFEVVAESLRCHLTPEHVESAEERLDEMQDESLA